ncbi:hypothetical protein KCP75_00215 [Salmonella enterica subsp. enterica]|nr:hypothetical protein KCP75_00215 [Salmonella enterica subsp. enterica]
MGPLIDGSRALPLNTFERHGKPESVSTFVRTTPAIRKTGIWQLDTTDGKRGITAD